MYNCLSWQQQLCIHADHCIGSLDQQTPGALYKSGHTATCTAKLEGREVFVHVQIRRIFLMSLRERHIHLIEVDTVRKIAVQHNLGADIVESHESGVFIRAGCLGRKVMLTSELNRAFY